MSTLQISLAVVGVILLGLIVAYNAWNYRRHAPKRPRPVDGDKAQLEPSARFEPALDGLDITSMPQPAPAAVSYFVPFSPSTAGISPTCVFARTSSGQFWIIVPTDHAPLKNIAAFLS